MIEYKFYYSNGTSCTRGLGHFKDKKELLMEAAKYLERHTENGTQKEGRCL